MKKYARVINIETLKRIAENKGAYEGVILGHENCPQFYRQSNVREMIDYAQKSGLEIKVNIPVLFEEYMNEFLEEADYLMSNYPNIKIYVNDWGLLYYLHGKYPNSNFGAGKGISFTYGDNPWNEHILLAEKEKYQQSLRAANMENLDTMEQLKELGVDEIEMSDLKLSESAYKNLRKGGFCISVNKGMSVATMSRACHCLRFLDKVNEMGNCINYCTKEIVLSIKEYYDMAENENKPVSKETKAIQPDMYVNGNIVMVKNDICATDYTGVSCMIYDERIMDV